MSRVSAAAGLAAAISASMATKIPNALCRRITPFLERQWYTPDHGGCQRGALCGPWREPTYIRTGSGAGTSGHPAKKEPASAGFGGLRRLLLNAQRLQVIRFLLE